MEITLREAGNSLVVTIPREIITSIGIKKGDVLDVKSDNKSILITPVKKKLKGEIFLEKYYGKKYADIGSWDYEDVETGAPIGEEEW